MSERFYFSFQGIVLSRKIIIFLTRNLAQQACETVYLHWCKKIVSVVLLIFFAFYWKI